MLGGNLAMDKHPIQGGAVILLVASCYGNRVKLRQMSHLACEDFTFYFYIYNYIKFIVYFYCGK